MLLIEDRRWALSETGKVTTVFQGHNAIAYPGPSLEALYTFVGSGVDVSVQWYPGPRAYVPSLKVLLRLTVFTYLQALGSSPLRTTALDRKELLHEAQLVSRSKLLTLRFPSGAFQDLRAMSLVLSLCIFNCPALRAHRATML